MNKNAPTLQICIDMQNTTEFSLIQNADISNFPYMMHIIMQKLTIM